ncbi:MAG: CvpA family protein [Thiobacillaceae bacterium]
MTALDIIVLLIIGLTAVRGLMRGMVDTVFSLAAWFLAFVLGRWGAVIVAPMLPAGLDSPNIRYFAAFVIVFLVVLIGVSLVGHLIASALKAVGLGGADKMLGGLLGLIKGGMIVIGFTLAAGLTSLPRTEFWQSAALSNSLEAVAILILPLVPEKVAKYVKFS